LNESTRSPYTIPKIEIDALLSTRDIGGKTDAGYGRFHDERKVPVAESLEVRRGELSVKAVISARGVVPAKVVDIRKKRTQV